MIITTERFFFIACKEVSRTVQYRIHRNCTMYCKGSNRINRKTLFVVYYTETGALSPGIPKAGGGGIWKINKEFNFLRRK